jgi:hypothetical protein
MKSWTPHHRVPQAYSTGIFKTRRWGAELFIVVCLNDLQHWNKIRWQQGVQLLVVVALGTSNTLTKKNTTTRSHTPPHCVLRTCSTIAKKTRQWGVRLFTIVSLGPTTLEQKKTWWWKIKLFIVVSLSDLQHWNKRAWWWRVQLFIIMSLRLATLKQKKNIMTRKWYSCHWAFEWPATLEQKNMTTRSWAPHRCGPNSL